MRQLLYLAVCETPVVHELCTEGDDVRVYQRGSLGLGQDDEAILAIPNRPFLLIGALPTVPYQEVRDTSRAKSQPFQVWAYDYRGDYLRIEALLAGVRETVLGLVGRTSPSGARCTDARWQGESQDGTDPVLDSAFKYVGVQLIASQ